MKLWGGRFTKEEDARLKAFDNSLPFGKRFYSEDIHGSMAHAEMLGKCGIIPQKEAETIINGLQEILSDLDNGRLMIDDQAYEDIHSFVEINLTQRIGETGKKLHTARSRNDQVAVDTKLYAKRIGGDVIASLEHLIGALLKKAEENPVIMPGYTHLQRAQVVTLKYYLKAYVEMLLRDKKRVENALEILDECPLGSGALAGTTHQIDRDQTAKALGFKKPVNNFLDGVSDRDYLIELLSDFSLIAMHLSRLSEELVIWCTSEFHFIAMDDAYSTGSSMMPQKKNPDAAELIRGSAGQVYGSLMALLTSMKGIPLAYNKDMQLDKQAFMPAADTILNCLEIMAGMIGSMHVNEAVMKKAVHEGFLNATEFADYLVKKGVPFRDAHTIVGKAVLYCEEHHCHIEDIPLHVLRAFSELIDESFYGYIDYDHILDKGIKREMK